MRNIKLISITVVFLIIISYAEIYGSPLLMLDSTSAKGISLANIGTVQFDDVNFIMQNPGIIGNIKDPCIGISYFSGLFDANYIFGNFAFPFPIINIGITVANYSTKEFENILLDGSKGSGSLNMNETLLSFGGGMAIINDGSFNLTIGGTCKYISSKIYKYSSSGFAFDLGITGWYQPLKWKSRFIYGFTMQNIGSGRTYIKEKNKWPFRISIGLGYLIPIQLFNHFITPQAEYNYTDEKYNMGLEYTYRKIIFLRGGYFISEKQKLYSPYTTGIGIKYSQFQFDYAIKFVQTSTEKMKHCFTISYSM